MKRGILIVFGAVLLAGAATFAGVRFLHKETPSVAQTSPANEKADDLFPKTPSTNPARTGYQGQTLSYLGAEKVAGKYPVAYLQQQKDRFAAELKLIGDDRNNIDAWIGLAIIKKSVENYAGARDVLEYTKHLAPNNPTIYYDLGDLYASFLRDNKSAELNFVKAVQLDSYEEFTYLGLADFYRDFYPEKSAEIPKVLLSGLDHIKNNPNLALELASYYRSVGDKADAITYFELVLQNPEITGTQQALIQDEIKKLQ